MPFLPQPGSRQPKARRPTSRGTSYSAGTTAQRVINDEEHGGTGHCDDYAVQVQSGDSGHTEGAKQPRMTSCLLAVGNIFISNAYRQSRLTGWARCVAFASAGSSPLRADAASRRCWRAPGSRSWTAWAGHGTREYSRSRPTPSRNNSPKSTRGMCRESASLSLSLTASLSP